MSIILKLPFKFGFHLKENLFIPEKLKEIYLLKIFFVNLINQKVKGKGVLVVSKKNFNLLFSL